MPIFRCLLFALAALGVGVTSAHAAVITLNYDFSASGFGGQLPDPITASISVTLDDTVFHNNETAGITVTGLAIDHGAVAFNFNPFTDLLMIGGALNGVSTANDGTDDFVLGIINSTSTAPRVIYFVYRQEGSATTFIPSEVSISPSQSTVPEPATLSLLGLCLAGFGVRRWRKPLR